MKMRSRIAAFAASVMLLALGACGTTENPQQAADDEAAGSSGPITVTDSRGKKVELKAPAKKVVALEWGEAEMLASLGVMPVGVADTKGYSTWVTAEKLDSDVKDVGTRAEPSEDSILGLTPDLVVMEEGRDTNLSKRLEDKGLPVLVTKGADAKNGELDRMRSDLMMIAKATGTEDKAEQLLSDLDASLAEAKKKLADAGKDGTPFVMADGYKEGNVISIRPFGEGALVSQVAQEIGLKNAWKGKVDEQWGLGATDVEGLTTIKDDDVQFFYNASDGTDVFADGLSKNPIWKSLAFVKAGNVHKLTDGIWTFGGPKSCAQYADELVRILTS
jgi:iron complex transport system substrate-binding protein|nr:iron-siderophore ABC transporter substrate-binding protein [Thermocrispum municipale]